MRTLQYYYQKSLVFRDELADGGILFYRILYDKKPLQRVAARGPHIIGHSDIGIQVCTLSLFMSLLLLITVMLILFCCCIYLDKLYYNVFIYKCTLKSNSFLRSAKGVISLWNLKTKRVKRNIDEHCGHGILGLDITENAKLIRYSKNIFAWIL